MTLHEHVAAARRRLRDAGIPPDESDLDARLLAEHLLGWTTEQFFTGANAPEPAGFRARYDAVVGRRASREPVAYIVGHQEFWGLQFEVTPDVLIPRPETELIVEATLELFPAGSAPFSAVDVGTGSGCLAVAIAHERPVASIVATDVSEAALTVARRNARRHGVAPRVTFRRTDLADGLDGPFDAIVSNPPYVAERDRPGVQPEVRDHEPGGALFAGSDGLNVIARLVPDAPPRLRVGGWLVFEFGFGQADAVARLISSTPGLTMVRLVRDLQGIPRTAIAKRM